MERSKLREKVLLDLVSAPVTLLPGVGGLSLLLLSAVVGSGGGLLLLGGLGGLLFGVGTLLTRWIYRGDEITRQAFERLQAEALQKEEAALDDLARRLEADNDPRTEKLLADLRALYNGFRTNTGWVKFLGQAAAVEIGQKVEALFRGCIHSLERSLELWRTARQMSTAAARKTVRDSREEVLAEIKRSIEQLARTIDEVQALTVKRRKEQDLARIRQDLNESLDVARRVEERMQAFEAELGRSEVSAERE